MKKLITTMLLTLALTTTGFASEVFFGGRVGVGSMDKLSKELEIMHKTIDKGERIDIHLSSGGGSIYAGFSLMNKIKTMQKEGRKFKGIVRTMCASMCFAILQTLDERSAYPFAVLMQHKGSGGNRQHLDALDSMIEAFESKRIKLPKAIWKRVTEANIWLGSQEALSLGILDSITEPEITVGAKTKDELEMIRKFVVQKKEMDLKSVSDNKKRREEEDKRLRDRIRDILTEDAKAKTGIYNNGY